MEKQKVLSLAEDLEKALTRLNEALSLPPKNEINRDASIQRFEFTFELCWKLMQAVAKYHGIQVNSPRDAIRAAGRFGIIDDPEKWLEFLEARNMTSHVYDESLSKEIYEQAKEFAEISSSLPQNAKQYCFGEK